jgi:hypothetical protein
MLREIRLFVGTGAKFVYSLGVCQENESKLFMNRRNLSKPQQFESDSVLSVLSCSKSFTGMDASAGLYE